MRLAVNEAACLLVVAVAVTRAFSARTPVLLLVVVVVVAAAPLSCALFTRPDRGRRAVPLSRVSLSRAASLASLPLPEDGNVSGKSPVYYSMNST